MSLGRRAIVLPAETDIEWLPIVGLEQNEIVLRIVIARQERNKKDQAELAHDLGVLCSGETAADSRRCKF